MAKISQITDEQWQAAIPLIAEVLAKPYRNCPTRDEWKLFSERHCQQGQLKSKKK